jgi:hypothetical protein
MATRFLPRNLSDVDESTTCLSAVLGTMSRELVTFLIKAFHHHPTLEGALLPTRDKPPSIKLNSGLRQS